MILEKILKFDIEISKITIKLYEDNEMRFV